MECGKKVPSSGKGDPRKGLEAQWWWVICRCADAVEGKVWSHLWAKVKHGRARGRSVDVVGGIVWSHLWAKVRHGRARGRSVDVFR